MGRNKSYLKAIQVAFLSLFLISFSFSGIYAIQQVKYAHELNCSELTKEDIDYFLVNGEICGLFAALASQVLEHADVISDDVFQYLLENKNIALHLLRQCYDCHQSKLKFIGDALEKHLDELSTIEVAHIFIALMKKKTELKSEKLRKVILKILILLQYSVYIDLTSCHD